jgi:3-oxoacyl-[acyl-carrier protein] reductase
MSQLDLSSEASIAELITEVSAAWENVHVVVNNGGTCPYQTIDEISFDDWDAVLETNARGTFFLTRGLLGLLRAGAPDDRCVINLSSIAGQVGGMQTGIHYAASKAAILAITRTLARALAEEGIRVNAVCPGPVTSRITGQLNDERLERLRLGVPLGRFGTPEEVAWIIAALADPRAGFVTGATYDVNGGVRID